jgi:phosphoribosyl 1,2-cyclic phosphodiesterase
MLGSGSAGNSALVATDHCRILVDGGLSARQIVVRLEQCGITPGQLDGVLLTHEHGDHVCGLEVLCRKFHVPIYCNRLTAEAIRGWSGSLGEHKNWRLFQTGADFSICDIHVQTFSVPHDAVDPVGYVSFGESARFITDLGYATKMVVERLRKVHTLVIETNHDEKMLQADPHRPWPVKQRIQSRHGHLSNTAAATVIEQLLGGKLERVVLGHLSRDCNTPELAAGAIRAMLAERGRSEIEVHCAAQSQISVRFTIGQRRDVRFNPRSTTSFSRPRPRPIARSARPEGRPSPKHYSSSPTTRWITPAGSEIQKPSKSSRSCSTSSRRGTPLIFK